MNLGRFPIATVVAGTSLALEGGGNGERVEGGREEVV